MGKRHKKDKKHAMKEKKRIKELVLEAFEHFGKNELFKEEFVKYFQKKGMSKDKIDRLWIKADQMNIITIGVEPIWEPGHPLNIIGHKTVFELVGKEEY